MRKNLGSERRYTLGSGRVSSGFSGFRVGNTAESLLNVHHAVEAFSQPKKTSSKPSKQKLVVTDGMVTVTPDAFYERWISLKSLATRHQGLIVNIEEPLKPNASAKFVFGAVDKEAEWFTSRKVFLNGIERVLGASPRVNIEGRGVLTGDGKSSLLITDERADPRKNLPSTALNSDVIDYSHISSSCASFRRMLGDMQHAGRNMVTIRRDRESSFIIAKPDSQQSAPNMVEITSYNIADPKLWAETMKRVSEITSSEKQAVAIVDATLPHKRVVAVAKPAF